MADITQRLGFDVSAGISALNSLKTSVDDLTRSLGNLNKAKLGNVGRSLTTFGKKLDKVPGSANNAATALNNLGKAVGFDKPKRDVDQLNNSLDRVGDTAERVGGQVRTTIGGAFVFSKATAGLRLISRLLLDAADSAKEFQLSVAEVQTIAGGATFDELAGAVRNVASEFGRTEADTAAAAYQAFSNQVVQTTGELLTFLPTAERLAVATGSETQDSVNALSSVLNTYGDAAGTAEQISDVLFKTVELGRTRFSEFANSLGTINSIAKEAGVSFLEVQSGIAAITKTGTTTSVALTQLRGIFAKLVKPTDKMKAAFASFGSKDGPSFVKASGGVIQALERLQQFADKSGISILELFGRIRGGQGALNLLRGEGEDFKTTLEELSDAAGSTKDAFDTVADTDAFKATKAFNDIQIKLTELGEAVLPVLGKFAELFNSVIPNTQSLTVLIGGATAAMILLAGAGAFALFTLTGLGTFLAPIAPLLGLIALGTIGVVAALKLQNDAVQKGIDLRTEESKAAAKASADRVKEASRVVQAIEASIKDVNALLEAEFKETLAALRKNNEESIKSFDSVIEAFGASRENVLKQIESAIKRVDSAIAASNKRARSALQELADIKFDESTERLTGQAKFLAEFGRASKTAALAREQFANAGQDADKRREALDTRALAREQLGAAKRTASTSKRLSDGKRVANAEKKLLQDIIKDEEKFSKDSKKFQDEARAEIVAVTKAFKLQGQEIVASQGKLKEYLSVFDEFGELKTKVQIFEDVTKAVAEAKVLKKLLSEDVTGGLAARAGVDETQGRPEALAGSIEFVSQSEKTIRSAQEVIESQTFKAKLDLQTDLKDVTITLNTETALNQIDNLKAQVEQKLSELNSEIIITPKIDDGGFLAGISAIAGKILGTSSGAQAAFKQQIRQAVNDAATFSEAQVEIAQGQLEGIQGQIKEQIANPSGAFNEQTNLKALDDELTAAKSVLDASAAKNAAEKAAAQAAAGDAGTKVDEATQKTKELTTETSKVAPEVAKIGPTASAQIGQINAVASAWKDVAREASLAAAAGGGAGGTAFFGKAIHRQTGGFTRGQDRILTSTSPGEVVINANAARGMRSELQAINAQQTPQFRETGGTVNNVGDVNMNFTQAVDETTARGAARDLKRELRTRTSSL